AAALGQAAHVAPEKVVIQLLSRRFLEAEHLAALRIHAGHDVLDRPVLAGCIHRLQHNQEAIAIVGVEQLLRLGEILQVLLQAPAGPLPDVLLTERLHLRSLGPAGIVVLEPDLRPRRNAENVDDLLLDHDAVSLTTRTGQGASRTTSSARLPQITRLRPVRPCVPMTIRVPVGSLPIRAKSNFLASPGCPMTTEYWTARPGLSAAAAR